MAVKLDGTRLGRDFAKFDYDFLWVGTKKK